MLIKIFPSPTDISLNVTLSRGGGMKLWNFGFRGRKCKLRAETWNIYQKHYAVVAVGFLSSPPPQHEIICYCGVKGFSSEIFQVPEHRRVWWLAPCFARCFVNRLHSKEEEAWNFFKSRDLFIEIRILPSPRSKEEVRSFSKSQTLHRGTNS